MSFIYVFAIVAVVILLTIGTRFVNENIMKKLRRASALVIGVVALLRCMIRHEAVFDVRGLNMYSPFGDFIPQTVLSIILVWFTYAALLSILLLQFFDANALRALTRYFSLPVLCLDLVFFNTYVTAIVGKNAFVEPDFRIPLIAAEITLALVTVLSDVHLKDFKFSDRSELVYFLSALPLTVFAMMPSYVPQALLGWDKTGIKLFGLSEAHRFAIYIAILLPFLLFHLLKNKSYETKRLSLIYCSVGMLWSFLTAHPISDWVEPWNWPLHLCSLAMFMIPLCLIFKLDKLCYAGLYVSVVGSLVMMLTPKVDPTVNAMATDQVTFWLNHYAVFGLPMLIVALKIFKRPTFKDWVYSTMIFTGYFVTILILNAWFVNYNADVDFLFLNGSFIVDKLGKWAQNIKAIEWSLPIGGITLKFYPLYQALFYASYVAISAIMWMCFKLLFALWDRAEARRLKERDYKQMKIDLKNYFGGASVNEPMHGDGSPRLTLRGFAKKYGANKHYSVDHVSFTVKGGEIFGFLGPNGAGKSTIIKSVVGIQTITEGNIEICGYDVERQAIQSKLNTGFVPDHYALYENLTGREYINYIADLYEVDEQTRNETIEKYVTRFQLTGSFDNHMKTYSHGMKQKIAIMAALVHNPKVWILDEPLTGLDPNSIFEVKECMKEHAAAGNIVFFSSHIIDVVEKICDKIAIIKKGRLRAVASVDELDARGIDLEAFYLETINADENAPLVNIGGDDILDINYRAAEMPLGGEQI